MMTTAGGFETGIAETSSPPIAHRTETYIEVHVFGSEANILAFEGVTVGKQFLAVLCPDWRPATLVLNATDCSVVFANLDCIRLLTQESPAYLIGDRLHFRAAELDRRFQTEVRHLIASGAESACMIGQDPVANCWVSAMVRNSQGFFRDVIESNLGRFASDCHLMIVELAMGSDGVDPAALAVFAAATSLSKAEADLVKAIANGHSLSELAEARGVAVSTIRQRMKSVLGKTGCRRQTELVRLVLSLCPKRPSGSTSGVLSTRPSRPVFAPSAAPSLMP